MERAHDLFESLSDVSLRDSIAFHITESSAFEASVSFDEQAVSVSTGCVQQLDELWASLWDTPVLTTGENFIREAVTEQFGESAQDFTDWSLSWLCLHELMHLHLVHGQYMRAANLIEVGEPGDDPSELGSAVRATLTPSEQGHVRQCLEMQADSEATDYFLGLYEETRGADIRALAAFAFAVIVLIERENTRRANKNITHPAAGTRFFTLLAHLFQMWRYPGAELTDDGIGSKIVPANPYQDGEFEAYASNVLMPVVNDAVVMAAYANASNFLIDLGQEGAIFQDIFTVQFAEELSADVLKTDAAKEWLRLMPINHKLLKIAGHR